MKRRWLFILMVFACIASGCAGQATSDNPVVPAAASVDPAPEDSAAKEEQKLRTVTHSLGVTAIPENPQRIAITHQVLLDWLHPLGLPVSISPMASPRDDFQPYTPADQRERITLIGPPGEPNLEALLQAEPDLMFVNWGHEKVYDQLAQIAPSVFVAFQDDWRAILRQYGEMLGKQQEAEDWLSAYEQKAAEAREKLAPLRGESVVFIRFLPKEMRIYNNHPSTSVGGLLYHDLGLTPVTEPTTEAMYEAISLEGLVQLNPDHIFMQIGFIPDTDTEAQQRYEEITSSVVWNRISAVEKGQVYLVDAAFFSNTALAKEYQISVVLDQLLKQ